MLHLYNSIFAEDPNDALVQGVAGNEMEIPVVSGGSPGLLRVLRYLQRNRRRFSATAFLGLQRQKPACDAFHGPSVPRAVVDGSRDAVGDGRSSAGEGTWPVVIHAGPPRHSRADCALANRTGHG